MSTERARRGATARCARTDTAPYRLPPPPPLVTGRGDGGRGLKGGAQTCRASGLSSWSATSTQNTLPLGFSSDVSPIGPLSVKKRFPSPSKARLFGPQNGFPS